MNRATEPPAPRARGDAALAADVAGKANGKTAAWPQECPGGSQTHYADAPRTEGLWLLLPAELVEIRRRWRCHDGLVTAYRDRLHDICELCRFHNPQHAPPGDYHGCQSCPDMERYRAVLKAAE